MGKIKVEMLTERKIIDVQPGMLFTSPDRIGVDVCLTEREAYAAYRAGKIPRAEWSRIMHAELAGREQ